MPEDIPVNRNVVPTHKTNRYMSADHEHIAQLEQELAAARSGCDRLSRQLRGARQENTQLQQQLAMARDKNYLYEWELAESQTGIGIYERGLPAFAERLNAANAQIADVTDKLWKAERTIDERNQQVADVIYDVIYRKNRYQRELKHQRAKTLFLQMMNEIVRLMPDIALGYYSKGGTSGGFGISGIPDIKLEVDMDAQLLEVTNTAAGRRFSSELYFGRLTSQAFVVLEAMLPGVTLTRTNTPVRVHADMFVLTPNQADARPWSNREFPELTDDNVYGNHGQRPWL